MFLTRNSAHAYRKVGIESDVAGASPHRLVHLLYDSAIGSVHAARQGIGQGKVAEKGQAILKAIRIVDEGLKAGLDRDRGGEIAARLATLYDYIVALLLKANLRNDLKALDEVESLLGTLRDAWDAIEPAPTRPTGATRTPYGSFAAA
ncbi:MAG: flagellar export chaperone FliS [Betaproteobacteria bacterium]|nr:flagellar export chaperone FliS [Betaproteobacteria bacterium]